MIYPQISLSKCQPKIDTCARNGIVTWTRIGEATRFATDVNPIITCRCDIRNKTPLLKSFHAVFHSEFPGSNKIAGISVYLSIRRMDYQTHRN
jgi:hypothetical protein